MPLHMVFVAKTHRALSTRIVLLVGVTDLVPLELLLPLKQPLTGLTLKFPHVVMGLIDMPLQFGGFSEGSTALFTCNAASSQ